MCPAPCFMHECSGLDGGSACTDHRDALPGKVAVGMERCGMRQMFAETIQFPWCVRQPREAGRGYDVSRTQDIAVR